METLKVIHSRRSVRKYTDATIGKEVVETLLRAAMASPTAGNSQTWKFVVIDDPAMLARVPEAHPYAGMAKNAPCAIMVCGDLSAEKYPGNWMLDCAAATQNILLAIEDMGLGGVWCGLWPDEDRVVKFQKMMGIPENVIPLSLVVFGGSAQELAEQDRYDAAKVHWNKW